MKSIAFISLLATGALAQSSTSSNPLIPSGISSGCSSFLTTLNSNSTLSSCLAPLVSATTDFGPSSNATGSPSASTISTALNNVCGSSTSCDESTIRSQLASFYSACSAELTSSSNQDVIRTYDVLYALTPLKTAICAKDDSGRYCVTTLSDIVSSNATSVRVSTSSSGSKSSIADTLWTSISSKSVSRRAETAQVALIPNVTTYRESNILFLFLDGTLSSSKLCTTCTRSVMTAYMTFEASVPYAPGIANSVLLSGQSDLYSGIESTCGSSFLQGSVQAAGGSISSGLVGAAPRSLDGKVAMAGAMLGSLFAGAVAVL
ncbi:hypothetical protein HETIRDRAFT_477638 [Heterobasidion irregulare TC 32-1]|uniref:DUF7729 domain-containing protein n=1 Tax=Heterobasidion irregulare (strain TC 32-1) TaxID=747525 RepID=W4K2L1_HETIT|nr:uncharacterized protein HETIRDRAFT_477638 [Heterobasidion irregulare TC 32-1]ETW80052.1 hypothetical protein HETIRDRAFT_477638 [Heterobasidion irregulare TC 32-1]